MITVEPLHVLCDICNERCNRGIKENSHNICTRSLHPCKQPSWLILLPLNDNQLANNTCQHLFAAKASPLDKIGAPRTRWPSLVKTSWSISQMLYASQIMSLHPTIQNMSFHSVSGLWGYRKWPRSLHPCKRPLDQSCCVDLNHYPWKLK